MENSEILLNRAIEALSLINIPKEYWTVGGGTVLKLYYNHRESEDIDIFISDAQYLGGLSPKLNDFTNEALDYNEMGNYIKLIYPEGKVDFIVSGNITNFTPCNRELYGHNVMVEDPVEIVCKKIYFRGHHAKARDIFDLATVYNSERRSDLVKAVILHKNEFYKFIEYFKKLRLQPLYSDEFSDMLRPGCSNIKGKEYHICEEFIAKVKKQIRKNER